MAKAVAYSSFWVFERAFIFDSIIIISIRMEENQDIIYILIRPEKISFRSNTVVVVIATTVLDSLSIYIIMNGPTAVDGTHFEQRGYNLPLTEGTIFDVMHDTLFLSESRNDPKSRASKTSERYTRYHNNTRRSLLWIRTTGVVYSLFPKKGHDDIPTLSFCNTAASASFHSPTNEE